MFLLLSSYCYCCFCCFLNLSKIYFVIKWIMHITLYIQRVLVYIVFTATLLCLLYYHTIMFLLSHYLTFIYYHVYYYTIITADRIVKWSKSLWRVSHSDKFICIKACFPWQCLVDSYFQLNQIVSSCFSARCIRRD